MNRIHIPNIEMENFKADVIVELKKLGANEKDFQKVTRELVSCAIINHISAAECAKNILRN